jgi:hypothetical protein
MRDICDDSNLVGDEVRDAEAGREASDTAGMSSQQSEIASLWRATAWGPGLASAARWTRMLAGFSALQAVVQALAFAAGILGADAFERRLRKYTVVGAAIAFTGLLSDLGLSQASWRWGGSSPRNRHDWKGSYERDSGGAGSC